jgi:hypothetical protein
MPEETPDINTGENGKPARHKIVLKRKAEVRPAPYPRVEIPRLPFNDMKHAPSRAEIDLLLGVTASFELKRFEERIELLFTERINWDMHWYDAMEGWGYRASYRGRVVCILHFYKNYFTVSISIPDKKENEFLAIQELTPKYRMLFENNFKVSPGVKWLTFHVKRKVEVDAMVPVIRLKLLDIREKTASQKE